MPLTKSARTALIIIDMDNDNCTGPFPVYNLDEYISNAVRAREACHAAGIPVIHAKQTYSAHGLDAALCEVRLKDGITPRVSVEGTHGHAIISELDPGGSDVVVRKHRWDAFFQTTMLSILHALDAEQLVFLGGFTDACVLTSVFGGYFNDYPCGIICDASSCDNEFTHKAAMVMMANWVFDLTVFTTENFVRWTRNEPAPYWFGGRYNTVPARSSEELEQQYDALVAGNVSTAEPTPTSSVVG